ncbi:MAG: ABC transporter ATP-binding protein [Planctomycetota bacterium]|nr:ABC transporter ATP-binding protein [Planctomycetota bacterium]
MMTPATSSPSAWAVELLDVSKTFHVRSARRRGRRPAPDSATPTREHHAEIDTSAVSQGRTATIRALGGVSLRVAPGQFVALLGPNGSGKSTLLKTLSLTLRPDTGQVLALGARLESSLSSRERMAYLARVGIVFQSPALDPLLTVRENLRLQAALTPAARALTSSGMNESVERVARELGLFDRLGQRVKTLSGGFARRVDLARALLGEPDLVLLDEPSAGLDYAARMALLDALSARRERRSGLVVLAATHHIDEAERADRVVLMKDGAVAAEGTPLELCARVGERVVRCPARGPSASDAAEVLRACGLKSSVTGSERRAVIDRQTPDAGELALRVAAALDRIGVAFSIQPPTLADAYLMFAGSDLGA